jgi:beta-phosphoglucomutase-like phosphatase (HAD superfamily)
LEGVIFDIDGTLVDSNEPADLLANYDTSLLGRKNQ